MWRQHENSLCYRGLLWARRLSYLKVPASLCLRKQVNSSFYLAFIGIIDVAIENTVINSIIILSENQNNLSKEQSESKHSNLADRLNMTITVERIYLELRTYRSKSIHLKWYTVLSFSQRQFQISSENRIFRYHTLQTLTFDSLFLHRRKLSQRTEVPIKSPTFFIWEFGGQKLFQLWAQ